MDIFKFLWSMFRSRKIKFLGRSGILYKRDRRSFFINSEFLEGNPEIVIYSDKIYIDNDNQTEVTGADKVEILDLVKSELEREGLRVEIHPPISNSNGIKP